MFGYVLLTKAGSYIYLSGKSFLALVREMKRINLGMSYRSKEESFLAGQEAVQMALDNLQGSANFLYIATTGDYNHSEVLRGIQSIAGDIPSAGGPTEGILYNEGLKTEQMVAVMAFQFRDVQAVIEWEEAQDVKSSGKIGEALASKISSHVISSDLESTFPVLLMIADGHLCCDIVLRSITNTLGPLVSVIGGSLYSAICGPFVNYTIPDKPAVLGVLFQAKSPIGIGVAHGWTPSGQSVVATRTEANRIFELNGRPALDVYKKIWKDIFPDIAGKNYQEKQKEFYQFAAYYPLGLAQATGEYLIRDPYAITEDGSIICAGEVPEDAILHFMYGESKPLLHAAKTATQQALDQLEGHPIEAVLFFDCITRFSLPHYNILDELNQIKETIGVEVPILGVLSRGEIATPSEGPALFHNKTLVLSAFSS